MSTSTKCWDAYLVETELTSVIQQLGHMPSKTELINMGRGDLTKAIQRHGGLYYWATKLNIKPTRERWTIEKIQQRILDHLIDGRMPTHPELNQLGCSDLSSAIIASGGFRHWATRLGLDLKNTETHIGNKWEDWVVAHLTAQGFVCERQSTKCEFDLIVRDGDKSIRVDVKSSHYHKYATTQNRSVCGYTIGINKPNGHMCDMYIVVCISNTDEPLDVYYIPARFAPLTTITLSNRSKYSVFRNDIGFLMIALI